MLKLTGRADATRLTGPLADDVWRVCLPEDPDVDRSGALACLLRDGQAAPPGYGLYLMAGHEAGMAAALGPVLRLGPDLVHLDRGDIIGVPEDGRRVTVLSRDREQHKHLLVLPGLTLENCDVYQEAQLSEQLRGKDVVINLVGILNERGFGGAGISGGDVRAQRIDDDPEHVVASDVDQLEALRKLQPQRVPGLRGLQLPVPCRAGPSRCCGPRAGT